MKLKELIEVQSSGLLKATVVDNVDTYNMDKLSISTENCKSLLTKLGWLEYAKTPAEILSKTDKFVNGIKNSINKDEIIENTEITFQNRRKTNTLSYFDRIKLVNKGKFDITVLRGMSGVGGVYGVYSAENNFSKPVYSCRSLRQLGEWINKLI